MRVRVVSENRSKMSDVRSRQAEGVQFAEFRVGRYPR